MRRLPASTWAFDQPPRHVRAARYGRARPGRGGSRRRHPAAPSVRHAARRDVQGGLDHPWDIAFTDDGRMLVTERIGRVRVFASGEPDAELLSIATIPDVRAELESGLDGDRGQRRRGLRLRVARSRATTGGSSSCARRWPMTARSHRSSPSRSARRPGAARHQGCAVEVDATDHLWLTIGDANLPAGENPRAGSGSAQRQGAACEPRRIGPGRQPVPGRRVQPRPPQPTGAGLRARRCRPGRSSTGPMRTTRSTSSSPAATTDTRASPAPIRPGRSPTAAARPPTTCRPHGRRARPRSPPRARRF